MSIDIKNPPVNSDHFCVVREVAVIDRLGRRRSTYLLSHTA